MPMPDDRGDAVARTAAQPGDQGRHSPARTHSAGRRPMVTGAVDTRSDRHPARTALTVMSSPPRRQDRRDRGGIRPPDTSARPQQPSSALCSRTASSPRTDAVIMAPVLADEEIAPWRRPELDSVAPGSARTPRSGRTHRWTAHRRSRLDPGVHGTPRRTSSCWPTQGQRQWLPCRSGEPDAGTCSHSRR